MKTILQKALAVLCVCALLVSAVPAYADANATVLTVSASSVQAGGTFTVTAGYTAAQALLAVQMQISYSADLFELVQTEKVSATQVGSGNPFIAICDSDDGSKAETLVKLTLRVKAGAAGQSGTVSIQNGSGSDAAFQTVPLANASKTVTVAAPKSGDATLSALSLNGASMQPTFSAGVTAYTASVANTVTSVSVNAKATDGKAAVAVSGGTLKVGANPITVTVTAENGTKKVYQITVTRAAATLSNNAQLKSLRITGSTLPFSAAITEYELTVPNKTAALDVQAVPAEANAKVTVSGHQALKVGTNYVVVRVTAPDGKTTKEYHVTVRREAGAAQNTSSAAVSSKPTSSVPVSSKPTSSVPVSSKPTSSVPVSSKPTSSATTSSEAPVSSATPSEAASSEAASSATLSEAVSSEAASSSAPSEAVSSEAASSATPSEPTGRADQPVRAAAYAVYIGGMLICLLIGCMIGYYIRGKRDGRDAD